MFFANQGRWLLGLSPFSTMTVTARQKTIRFRPFTPSLRCAIMRGSHHEARLMISTVARLRGGIRLESTFTLR